MNGDPQREGLANALGAASMAIADEVIVIAERVLQRAGATSAALCAIGHVGDLTIDMLARLLELSHPGAVRVIDRLVADGLVRRVSGLQDKRQVEVHLTASGRRSRRAILSHRQTLLERVVGELTPTEAATLAKVVQKILAARINEEDDALRICRFCDESACAGCPVVTAVECLA